MHSSESQPVRRLRPAETPQPIIAKLNQSINDSLALPEVRNGAAALMLQPTGGSPQAFVDFLARDRQRWDKIIQNIC
jgi:tripartite-type tricarboxylate transporter receptor subunit TctC